MAGWQVGWQADKLAGWIGAMEESALVIAVSCTVLVTVLCRGLGVASLGGVRSED